MSFFPLIALFINTYCFDCGTNVFTNNNNQYILCLRSSKLDAILEFMLMQFKIAFKCAEILSYMLFVVSKTKRFSRCH